MPGMKEVQPRAEEKVAQGRPSHVAAKGEGNSSSVYMQRTRGFKRAGTARESSVRPRGLSKKKEDPQQKGSKKGSRDTKGNDRGSEKGMYKSSRRQHGGVKGQNNCWTGGTRTGQRGMGEAIETREEERGASPPVPGQTFHGTRAEEG